MAARPIGGLCARSLRFESGFSLEDVVVRHALGTGEVPARIGGASGVMMIPTPARVPSALRAVDGVDDARAVAGIDDVVISVRVGETLVPLPEGAQLHGVPVRLRRRPPRPSNRRCATPPPDCVSRSRRWCPSRVDAGFVRPRKRMKSDCFSARPALSYWQPPAGRMLAHFFSSFFNEWA